MFGWEARLLQQIVDPGSWILDSDQEQVRVVRLD